MFYLDMLIRALFSFDIIIYLCDYSVLEIDINVTVNSNSVETIVHIRK